LQCRRAGQLQTFHLPPGSGPVETLALDAAGDCWAATAKGLLLRVRAFLFIGTVTFILQVLWQLWRFMSDYSFMLLTLGILLGLLLIWVAATFEARRSQVNILVQRWASQLEQWE
jgi:hypothetical protein